MNIFVLDLNHTKCAQYQFDRHAVKMILETCQILCSVHHTTGTSVTIPYKKTHVNHPCVIWTRSSIQNYHWLLKLGFAQSVEYTHRYGKIHKCHEVLKWCEQNVPTLPDIGLTPFVQCMDEQFKDVDTVTAYRNLYRLGKSHLASWKNRSTPSWFTN